MNLNFARKLIEFPNEKTTEELFQGVDGVFWVDWREADEDIIQLAAETMLTFKLSPQWIDEKLTIEFQGRISAVPLKFEPGEQDITLRALNKAMQPELEIRYVNASKGGDTAAFLTLDGKIWLELEAEFGDKVSEAFTKFGDQTSFLNDKNF